MTKYRLRIEQDDSPQSPREMDPLGMMLCFHKRYTLGDKHSLHAEDFPLGWSDIESHLTVVNQVEHVLRLYLYDHSGLTMSTTPFGDRWDSGQIGFIYCTQKSADKWNGGPMTKERIEAALRTEVEVYNQYLQGDVWGYIVEEVKTCPTCSHVEYDHVDSCWGIYGEETAREDGQAALAALEGKPCD
jgi:hypothetical protein